MNSFCLSRWTRTIQQTTRRLFSHGLLDTERQIKQVLQQVVDPVVTSRSIISTGLVQGITIDKDQHRITLDLELFVPGHPYEAQVCLLITVSYLCWITMMLDSFCF